MTNSRCAFMYCLVKSFSDDTINLTNYDIDEAVNQESSANYLGAQMMEAAGIPLSDYQNYLLEQKKEMPLISTQHTEAEGSDAWLNYQTLQYYLLFDWDGEK